VVVVGLWTAGFVQLLRGGERYYLPGMAQALAGLGLSGRSVVIATALLMLLLPRGAPAGAGRSAFDGRTSEGALAGVAER
jgi:hypothetical protein